MGKPGDGPARPFRNKFLIGLLVVFGVLAIAGPTLFFKAAKPEPMTVAEFEATETGRPAQVIGEVTDVGPDGFRFEVLEGPPGDLQRTATVFEARETNYRVSLGSRADVKPGALLLVGGLKQDDRTLATAVVVVLTGKIARPD